MTLKKHLWPLLFCSLFLFATVSCSKENVVPSKEEEEPDVTENPYYAHKIVLEDYTSIGCPMCPYGSFAISEIEKSEFADKIIPIAIHDDYGIEDPWSLPLSRQYANTMQVKGLPSLFWNRDKADWHSYEYIDIKEGSKYFIDMERFGKYLEKQKLIKVGSNIGIKIASKLTNTSGEITVNIKFSEDLNKDLKFVVYVMEDKLVNKQSNGTRLYGNNTGGAIWDHNFVHNNTVLGANTIFGDKIMASTTLASEELKKVVKIDYKANKIENLKVAVLILDSKGNVLNAQIAKGNTVKDYEIANE